MTQILALNSSPLGDQSVSRLLVGETLARLLATQPDARVLKRDLAAQPVPHLTEENIAGVRGTPQTPAEHAARALSDSLIGELKAADLLVIGAPMHNFSVPTVLRAWFDFVLRPGETFGYTEAGPKGLLAGKRAILLLARGNTYEPLANKALDFQEPYLRVLLGFIGIDQVRAVRAEKIGFGAESRKAAVAGALQEIASFVSGELAAA